MHRYIESRPPLAFFIAAGGVRNFRGGGVQRPQPPDKYSPGSSSHDLKISYRLRYKMASTHARRSSHSIERIKLDFEIRPSFDDSRYARAA